MIIRILGSAAGGGFPQWNCGCLNCRGMREGTIQASPRTQESVCVSADDHDWFLINASPDVRGQIESFGALHARGSRGTPIQAIFLTNADLDHCLGLLSLRENQRLVIYATEWVRRGFTENNILYRTLERFAGQVTWRQVRLGVEGSVLRADGSPSGLTVTALALPGKPPIHLEDHRPPDPEMNVAFRFRQSSNGRLMAYLSAVGQITSPVFEVMNHADCVLFDGTFWSSDELSAPGYLRKSAQELAHWPVGGQEGSLARLSHIPASHRIFIHLNNTNPMLRDDSPERAAVEAAGWDVAHDGMEVSV